MCIYVISNLFSVTSNLQNKFFWTVAKSGATYRGEWLIHAIKHPKDNQPQSLNPLQIFLVKNVNVMIWVMGWGRGVIAD